MNPARAFIQRPIATVLMAVAVVLSGLLAWRLLPVAPLPQVDFPIITVSASLPGASPESMAATVATPLERALGSIDGITSIISSSNQGATQIMLQFELGRDLNDAARDVQAAINAARSQLPSGMPGNPQYRKVNPSQAPVMGLALSSPNLAPSELYDAAASILAQKLSQISGVGEVSVSGASLPAVRVQLDPGALLQYGIALDDVRNAISEANALQPLGLVENDDHRWEVRTSDPLRKASAYRELVIRHQDGAVVRLEDVAEVSDSVENRYSSGFHNDHPAVIMMISRQPGANIVETIDAIRETLPGLRALMPADSELAVVMDRSPGIRATLREAQITLLIAVALVVMVVWLFLGSARTALIPTVAIPVSLIGSFVVMYFYGFSVNNLSLMALIIAAGLVVDDAIVVLENIERHIENGLSPLQAAIKGAGEVGFTLLAMNLALVVVFVSILFMGGIVERLFREFSITLAAAMLISLVVSLTLTPSLCALWLREKATGAPSALARRSEAAFHSLQHAYAVSLDWALRHRLLTLLTLLAVVAVNVWLYVAIPKTTLPPQDTGQIRGFVRGDDGFSFQLMQPKIEVFRQLIMDDPAVQDVTGTSGGDGGITNAQLTINLKPLAQRGVSAQEVVNRLRAKAPHVPGGMMFLIVDQDIRLSGGFSRSDYELVLRSDSLELLDIWSRKASEAMQKLPELVDVDSAGDEEAQQVVLDIDREAARLRGVDMATVASVLNNSFSQRQVATLYDELNQYRVVMELLPRYTEQPSVLEQLEVLTDDGARVPLSTFATWEYGLTNDRIRHDSQFAATGVGYALAPGVTPVQAEEAIQKALNDIMLPPSVYAGPGSDRPNFEGNLSQPLLILSVLLAVYMVLGMLYESTLHPLTILSTLPSAGIGALLALRISDTPFSLIALLGLFLLIGIVMKNAILMIDFALEAQRRDGLAPLAAIRQAALLRLRPILMTNLAGLLGAVPLVLGLGEGSELRRPLGITIIGGLAFSQLLTLYTTPVIYLYLETLRQRTLRRRAGGTPLESV
ncbi:RND efflux transporter, permease protein [Alloalcanivorax dieselolei B5]|uniref:RND efflux transporter, permease protein n=1 Tax=Alcanivorax dieselolei (strain DSM 16502 / CGMCC 1.3690 / MCCC 1A00001 / B-5) TaxID=930169 RepID=K0CIQ4_ALCDB|nr:efflux RND transporter permease subunit [Alloalcanivorax dieselolei]AFT72528.1 RND efflux transporter, permease protein [Alloalcanivorax dieselolei B5]GGJ78489.1 acriflavine resistance protein B [Alloalcanivorax dieselolei]